MHAHMQKNRDLQPPDNEFLGPLTHANASNTKQLPDSQSPWSFLTDFYLFFFFLLSEPVFLSLMGLKYLVKHTQTSHFVPLCFRAVLIKRRIWHQTIVRMRLKKSPTKLFFKNTTNLTEKG